MSWDQTDQWKGCGEGLFLFSAKKRPFQRFRCEPLSHLCFKVNAPLQSASSQTVSILAFNVWFGPQERRILRMKPLESNKKREKRYQILVRELRGLQSDGGQSCPSRPNVNWSPEPASDVSSSPSSNHLESEGLNHSVFFRIPLRSAP